MYITSSRGIQWQLLGTPTPLHHVTQVTCHTGFGSWGLTVLKVQRRGPPILGALHCVDTSGPMIPPVHIGVWKLNKR